MKYELLSELLPWLDAYEKTNAQRADPQHFAVWLARHASREEQVENTRAKREEIAVDISKYLVFMNRYVRAYGRRALDGTALSTPDDFAYLAVLLFQGPMTKIDLIHHNRHEKPTGMEIIKRLLELGLVEQKDDPNDRRSKRLSISEAGKNVYLKQEKDMQALANVAVGNLNQAEQLLLLQLLEKLENFHQVLQAKSKNADFDGIVAHAEDMV